MPHISRIIPTPSRKCPFPLFWAVLSLLWCAIFVSIDLASIPIVGFGGFIAVAAQWLLVAAVSSALLLLIALNRYVFAVIFPLLTLAATVSAYYTLTIGVGITAGSIELAVVNNATMWMGVVTPALMSLMILAILLAVVAVVVRSRCVASCAKAYIWAVAALAVMILPPLASPRISSLLASKMPCSLYYATKGFLRNHRAAAENRDTFRHTPATPSADAPDVIVILGESLRADHLPMNGYHRNTMPALSRDSLLVSLPNIYSPAIHTHASIPQIMTRADSLTVERGYNEQSFITIFRKAGYSSAWFANQDLADSYTYFAHETDTIVHCNSARSLYNYGQWLDSDLLRPFAEWLSKPSEAPKLAILHTIGSHWWYNSHYDHTQAIFTPDADHKDIARLSHEQIVNSYDNTIIATDAFISDVISLAEQRNAIVIYISDHGEGLGENGLYMHAAESDPLHHPACLIRMSPRYIALFPGKYEALRKGKDRHAATDAIFHTAIDAAGISTPVLDPGKSLLRPSKQGRLHGASANLSMSVEI